VLVRNFIQQDKDNLIDRTVSDDVGEPKILLNEEERKELQAIIQELRENYDIFNPSHICDLADKLEKLSSVKELHVIKEKLYTAADTFDDQAIEPIVKRLEEIHADK
jgi:hypothetical protein